MMKIAVVATSLAALPIIANAASLISPPVTVQGGEVTECSINYLGKSNIPIHVLVSVSGWSELRFQEDVAVSAREPYRKVIRPCGKYGMPGCIDATCRFSFTGDKTLFRASACFNYGATDDTINQICMPAY